MRIWLCIIALVFSIGLAGAAYRTGWFSKTWQEQIVGIPQLEAPDVVDAPVTEQGQLAEAKFSLTNRGKKQLVLTEFHSGCACDGLEVKEGDRYVRLTELRLEPLHSAEVRFVQSARGEIGGEIRNAIYFLTNDPAQPEAKVVVRIPTITGGATILPTHLEMGVLGVGGHYQATVDVYDRSGQNRPVESVSSSLPETIRVRFIPKGDCVNPPTGIDSTAFLGRVAVSAITDRAVDINGVIKVHLLSRPEKPDIVTINGRVAPQVDVAPATIALPLQSENGPVYQSSFICRSPFQAPFALTVAKCPPELVVTIDDRTAKTRHLITISMAGQTRLKDRVSECIYQVKLNAQFEGVSAIITIPVAVRMDSR